MPKLTYHVQDNWDGSPGPGSSLWADIECQWDDTTVTITATMPLISPGNNPTVPEHTRVSNLWEYDVAELFLVGDNGHYLEIELGAKGHFLVLSFSDVRVRSNEHEQLNPTMTTEKGADTITHTLTLPVDVLPGDIVAANAFVISGDHFLAAHPLPGDEADFHQPSRFPRI